MMTAEIGAARLADLIKEVQAGNEVLLTEDNKPVAKLVAAADAAVPSRGALQIQSFKGHRVLTPIISQSEIADEMFSRP